MKFNDIHESIRKSDVRSTERKMDKEVIDMVDNNEINFINNFLKKGEKIDGKIIKSIDGLLAKYKQKIGTSKTKNDPDLLLLAPIIASIYNKVKD